MGIVSESDLILSEEESDLHLPHYLNIMGGIVFVGSMKGFEKRLDKAFATKVSELMTPTRLSPRPTTTPNPWRGRSPRSTTTTSRGRCGRPPRPAWSRGPTRWPRWSSPSRAWRGRSPGSTSAQSRANCARLEPTCAPAPSSAPWSRPTATDTVPRRARERAGRRCHPARRRDRLRGRADRPPLPACPAADDGCADRRGGDSTLSSGAEVAVWREGFRAMLPPAPAPRAARPGFTSRRQRHGAARQPDPGEVLALARACAEDPELELAGVWTHFATADDPTRTSSTSSSTASRRSPRRSGPSSRRRRPRRQQRRRLPRPALALRHGPLRRRRLRARPLPGRSGRSAASPRRSRCAPTSPT